MPITPTPREQFEAKVRGQPSLWLSLDFRVLAVRCGREWHALSAHGYLRGVPPADVARLEGLPRLDELRAYQEVLPISELKHLLDALEAGHVVIAGEEVHFVHDRRDGPPKPIELREFNFFRSPQPGPLASVLWPGYVLRGSGDSLSSVLQRTDAGWEELDEQLEALESPFSDIANLAVHLAGRKGWFTPGNYVTVAWFAPLEAAIDEAQLVCGELTCNLVAGSSNALRHASLSIRPVTDAVGNPSVVVPTQLPVDSPIQASQRAWRTEVTASLSNATSVEILLRLARRTVGVVTVSEFLVGGRNARISLYEAVDKNSTLLRDWLTGVEGGAQHFENAVARVFVLAGLQVDFLAGPKQLGDSVDLLVHDPTHKRCFAVECTTGSLNNNGKIGKVVMRRELLRDAAHDIEVVGVLAASAPASAIAPVDMTAAAKAELRVLSRESLLDILTLAHKNSSARKVSEFIYACRPAAP